MIDEISATEAMARAGAADVVFIDVREVPEMQQTGVLPGAIPAPMSRLRELTDRRHPDFRPEFASGKELIIYCATGRRSASVAEALARIGIPRAVNLAGGIVAWQREGGKVEPFAA